MRYRANAKILSKGGKELGRVTYTVKARNRADAKRKIGRLMKSRVHRGKNPRTKAHKHFAKGTRAETAYLWAAKMRKKFPGRQVEVRENLDGSWDGYVWTPKVNRKRR